MPGSNDMTEQAQQQPDMLSALQALLAQQQQPAQASGWTQPQPAALPITGISVPVKLETPIGSVRVDLHLPAECGQSPQALLGAIQLLANAGYPVDAWQPRDSGNGGGWGGNNGWGSGGWGGNNGGGSGGWGNRGGGYNRGSYYGGRRW